jgi:pyridoxine 5-phosphate synthase
MRFYVNVDHVATVRQARRTDEPDPVAAAVACERAGADGITVHLREDRRHIQEEDLDRLCATIATPLNLELATADDIVGIASELRPHQATFVPERRQEITTEGGLNLAAASGKPDPRLVAAIATLKDAGVRVSLFIDPDSESIQRAAELRVDAVELHTGEYANRFRDSDAPLERLARAAVEAKTAGLAVHAGHGLTYQNTDPVARIREIEELSIGHSVVSRSIMVGMESAVSEMRAIIAAARVD